MQLITATAWPLAIVVLAVLFAGPLRDLIRSLSDSLEVNELKIGPLKLTRTDFERIVDDLREDLKKTWDEMNNAQKLFRSIAKSTEPVDVSTSSEAERGHVKALRNLRVVFGKDVKGKEGSERVTTTRYGKLI